MEDDKAPEEVHKSPRTSEVSNRGTPRYITIKEKEKLEKFPRGIAQYREYPEDAADDAAYDAASESIDG